MIRIVLGRGNGDDNSNNSSGEEDQRELIQPNEDNGSTTDDTTSGKGEDDNGSEEDMNVESMEEEEKEREQGAENNGDHAEDISPGSGRKKAFLDKLKKVKKKKAKKSYDKSLPAQHLYLGELDEEGVASVKEEESTSLLPLLYVPERVLFPGETLPMHIHNPHSISFLRKAFAEHHPVAVCTDLRGYMAHLEDDRRPTQSELSMVGTTADIVACKEEDELRWYHGPKFIVKLMGRQRFQILEIYRRTNGLMDCQIRILPDVLMTPRPSHLFSCPPSIASGHMSTILHSHQPEATLISHKRALKSRNMLWSPSQSMTACPAPGWVMRMYDFDYLREKVLEAQHMQTIINEDKTVLPADAVSLSYWLARRLPVDDTTKLELLKMNCPTMRIIQGLGMLNRLTNLYCVRCESVIAMKEHIFSMSVDGPLAAYVNPGGVVHDTLTVLEATNLSTSGRGTTQDTWFPGYQWTIVYCKVCRDHKGWLFDAVKKDLIPKSFYGLRRPSLTLVKSNKPKQVPTFRIL